ncbi:ACP S-malonyltransferase [Legionella sp. CNM-4043-24]|uniref:ACP S-malonyltransferase n=1 Tax=Legionella sp. CNM-4043-24 TaxID=3421646 RepID=UPI00403B058C
MNHFACVFPGQGSQSIGMLSSLAGHDSLITDTFAEVSAAVGYDLWQLIQQGPEAKLNQTEFTQVAMLTADVAVFRLLQKNGMKKASLMAGHSLGEYAALVSANAIELTDAARLVATRGRLMQQTIPLGLGAMAAIVGLTDEQVDELCQAASQEGDVVTPANYNAVGQVVIAGHAGAVERAISLANEAGARMAMLIPVSVPCHCPLLLDAAQAFEEHLAAAPFKTPDTRVISNVDLSIYESAEQIRHLLARQLYMPVRWVETIRYIQTQAASFVLECGPGKVLSGLIKRIDRSLQSVCVFDVDTLQQALALLSVQATSAP